MNTNFYFPHDYSARNDIKILKLRARRGAQGYGVYWMLIEALHELKDPKISRDDLDALAPSFNVPYEELTNIVNDAINVGLFQEDGEFFYSQRIYEHLKIRENVSKARAEAGRRGGLKSKAQEVTKQEEASPKQMLSNCLANEEQPEANGQQNEAKERKGNKGNKGKEKTSTPPTASELAFTSFLSFRKKAKKPATDRAIELLQQKLKNLAGEDDALAAKIIEQSEVKGWLDFFPLKEPYQAHVSAASGDFRQADGRTASILGNHAKYALKTSQENATN